MTKIEIEPIGIDCWVHIKDADGTPFYYAHFTSPESAYLAWEDYQHCVKTAVDIATHELRAKLDRCEDRLRYVVDCSTDNAVVRVASALLLDLEKP
jgi:hypothetical protein